MSTSKNGFKFFVFLFIVVCVSAKSSNYPECEVCTDVLTKTVKTAEKNNDKLTPENVREALLSVCESVASDAKKTQNKDDERREKFCSFIGASKHSATSIVNDVAKPLAFFKPPQKVCDELKRRDSEICDLKLDKPIDWNTIDLSSMRVKQLKELLAKLKGDCKGCTEKSDYIKRIIELKPKTTEGEKPEL